MQNPKTRSEHSETYWRAIKYVILALTGLMGVVIALSLIVLFRII